MHSVMMQEVVTGNTLKMKLDRWFRSQIQILQPLLWIVETPKPAAFRTLDPEASTGDQIPCKQDGKLQLE
jgi:hypothetical protein